MPSWWYCINTAHDLFAIGANTVVMFAYNANTRSPAIISTQHQLSVNNSITMDQTHSRAREALQPFIHLANSTSTSSPRLIANLITNATSNPQTYFFAELLETPTVQSLRSPDTPEEFQGYLTLLEIFSWGTWQEYQCKLSPASPALKHTY
jgi:hypothetical protein